MTSLTHPMALRQGCVNMLKVHLLKIPTNPQNHPQIMSPPQTHPTHLTHLTDLRHTSDTPHTPQISFPDPELHPSTSVSSPSLSSFVSFGYSSVSLLSYYRRTFAMMRRIALVVFSSHHMAGSLAAIVVHLHRHLDYLLEELNP